MSCREKTGARKPDEFTKRERGRQEARNHRTCVRQTMSYTVVLKVKVHIVLK
jgi:hypothetical protein